MASKNTSNLPVAVLGGGSFGTAVANILAENSKVIFYVRNQETYEMMVKEGRNKDVPIHENITPSNDLEKTADQCHILFPVVPSSGFRPLIRQLSEHLYPYHILIHGTKGLDLGADVDRKGTEPLSRQQVKTMSEVIQEESVVVQVGCLAGPNLAVELTKGHPAATVVASHFEQVIKDGQRLLRSSKFQVYGNSDLIGIELCGVLKNIIAIASGGLSGLGLGENARALLISRGLLEMIHIGQALGGDIKAFLGLAGVGDLVATCSSTLSRNYTVGYRMATGESLEQVISSMDEVAEGVNTVRIVKRLMDFYEVRAPITETLYNVLFNDLAVEEGLSRLMKIQFGSDINFM